MTRPLILAGGLVLNPAPPGSLLKRPRQQQRKLSLGRTPRALDAPYLALVRQLPCLKCGMEPAGEAAHVRMASAAFGKRSGMGEKPDDRWCAPLCPACHTRDPDSQHKVGEQQFWHDLGLNPLLICEELYAAAPDLIKMRAIVFHAVARRS